MEALRLKTGDSVAVWWGNGAAVIGGISTHNGNNSWRVANFTDGVSMTLTPYMRLKKIRK